MSRADQPGGEDSARQRLVEAWEGEIKASLVYGLLAAREKDEGRSAILERIAEAEKTHRRRLEARMGEMGIPVPDPSRVKLSLWERIQAKAAPIERVLAAREAAETFEIDDVYRTPTGDATTDALLGEIRKEEKSHSRAVHEMQTAPREDHRPATPQARLEAILGRERWHQTGAGWISGAIYGANDGLAAVFGIIAGVSAATGGSSFVLTAGMSGAIASAASMATGAFLAERSTAEVGAANLEHERRELEQYPEEEKEELSLFYQLKGMSAHEADELAERLASEPEAMLQVMAAEELGMSKTSSQPAQAALAAGLSTLIGALVPVAPFFFTRGVAAIVAAALISLAAHFLVGAAKALVTLRKWWASGLEMTVAGVVVGGVLYLVGLAFRVRG